MPELMYDEFNIATTVSLNNDDINALTKIYLPLMGIDSYSLYISLSSLDKSHAYNYRYLLDMLNFRSMKALNNALSKLEGMGLLKVYENKSKNYLYEIKRPLSIIDALNDGVIKTLLISQIGESEVDNLNTYYNNNYKGYKDITRSFDEIFDIKTESNLDFIKKLVPNNIEIKNDAFNYSFFKLLFDTSFIDEDTLDDPDFKANILRISFLHKLTEEQMKDVVISSLSVDKSLDYASLSKQAKIIYRNVNKSKEPRIATKSDDDYLDSIKDDQTLALCNWLERISPAEALESISHIKPSLAEITMFEELLNSTKFPVSVINFMILQVSAEKDGELPGYSYFEKIANTWARAKVKNVVDAINFIEKHNSEKATKTHNNNEKLPDWYNEYNKELEKKLEDNENLQTEEVQNILKNAKDLFGED